MTFTITRLVGDQALIQGQDNSGTQGKAVVSTSQWDELQARKSFDSATAEFDAAIEKFFSPLTEAAEKLDKAFERPDSSDLYVVKAAVEGTQGSDAVVVKLTHDSMILKLIESGDTDRLVWLNDETLVVTAPAQATATVEVDEDEVIATTEASSYSPGGFDVEGDNG